MCNIVRFPARQYEVSVYIIVFCLICVFEIRTKKNKQTKYKTPNKTFRLSFFFSFFCLDSFVFFKIFLFWFEFRSVCGYWRRIDLNITNNSRHSDGNDTRMTRMMTTSWRRGNCQANQPKKTRLLTCRWLLSTFHDSSRPQ